MIRSYGKVGYLLRLEDICIESRFLGCDVPSWVDCKAQRLSVGYSWISSAGAFSLVCGALTISVEPDHGDPALDFVFVPLKRQRVVEEVWHLDWVLQRRRICRDLDDCWSLENVFEVFLAVIWGSKANSKFRNPIRKLVKLDVRILVLDFIVIAMGSQPVLWFIVATLHPECCKFNDLFCTLVRTPSLQRQEGDKKKLCQWSHI